MIARGSKWEWRIIVNGYDRCHWNIENILKMKNDSWLLHNLASLLKFMALYTWNKWTMQYVKWPCWVTKKHYEKHIIFNKLYNI